MTLEMKQIRYFHDLSQSEHHLQMFNSLKNEEALLFISKINFFGVDTL